MYILLDNTIHLNHNIDIKCISTQCKELLPIELLKNYQILSNWIKEDEEIYKLLNFSKNHFILENYIDILEGNSSLSIIPRENRFYCPNCREIYWSDGPCSLKIAKKKSCIVCGYIFCLKCLNSWHTGLSCNKSKLQNSTSIERKSSMLKSCPKCNILTIHYKYHGCHHILPKTGCPNCGLHYCYACLTPKWPCKVVTCKITCSPRCDCPLCPDCTPGEKCTQCSGCPNCEPEQFQTRKSRRINKSN